MNIKTNELEALALNLLDTLSEAGPNSLLRIDKFGEATLREFGKPDRVLNGDQKNSNLNKYIYIVMTDEKDVCYVPEKKQTATLMHYDKENDSTSLIKIETIPEIEAIDVLILK